MRRLRELRPRGRRRAMAVRRHHRMGTARLPAPRRETLDALDEVVRLHVLRRERRQPARELDDGLDALLRILVQTRQHELFELLRKRGSEAAREKRRIGDDGCEQTGDVVRGERELAGEQLEEGDAERPDVASVIDVLRAPDLLRRHVRRRTEDRLRLGEVRVDHALLSDRLRDAEVEDLHERGSVGALGDEEVRRLEIAMDDADGMRARDRFAHLEKVVGRDRRRHRTALAKDGGEVSADEVLHHDVRSAALERAGIEHAHDVLALDLDDGASLACEALRVDLVAGRLRPEELDRDELAERLVTCGDDEPHAARADQPLDDVFADAIAHGGHRLDRGEVADARLGAAASGVDDVRVGRDQRGRRNGERLLGGLRCTCCWTWRARRTRRHRPARSSGRTRCLRRERRRHRLFSGFRHVVDDSALSRPWSRRRNAKAAFRSR